MPLENQLLKWYLINKRDLPWRKNKDPYSVWISEIILQQTRVSQGIHYYKNFMTDMRKAIESGKFEDFKEAFYFNRDSS